MSEQYSTSGGSFEKDTLIYDWNQLSPFTCQFNTPQLIELNDETLRDGLQCPSVLQPTLEQKLQFLRLMPKLGIDSADIGYAGASKTSLDDVVVLAKAIKDEHLPVIPNCAGRTHEADINPILEAQQRSGQAIEAALFIGSSPIRQFVEGWDLSFLLKTIEKAVLYARSHDLSVMFVTEDTTRALPEHIAAMYLTAAEAGASRACISDTVGHATPSGVQHLVGFLRGRLQQAGFSDLKLDWHGHRDRGLDVVNSMAALSAGASRVHGCALGIGERVGNTALDTLLVNLVLEGWMDQDLSAIDKYCKVASEMTGVPIPRNYPIVGDDAFVTSTGIHAAAILKARDKGDTWLEDRVYSAIPASLVGRHQTITIGPMSGQANVVAWLKDHQMEPTPSRITLILNAAKQTTHILSDDEIMSLLQIPSLEEK